MQVENTDVVFIPGNFEIGFHVVEIYYGAVNKLIHIFSVTRLKVRSACRNESKWSFCSCDFLNMKTKNSFYKSCIHLDFDYSITLLSMGSLEKGCLTQTLSSSAYQELSLE